MVISKNLKPSDIVDEVRQILSNANQGKGNSPKYMTAYQILNRLPSEISTRLIEERGLPGKGSGSQ